MEFRRRPRFRFTQEEVAEMEEHLRGLNNATPHHNVVQYLAEKFSASNARSGKTPVEYKQVRTWFQNRKYRAQPSSSSASNSGNNTSDGGQVEFEAKSTRNGAWYDVAAFLSRRFSKTGDQEVRVRFSGFGAEEDQWINVRKCVRLRSLPCEAAECSDVLPGDLILCHQEGKEQALYFDAHVLEVERRTHDISGCRCTFLVCYDHDQSKDIVPLRKVCRRPETRASASADAPLVIVIDHRPSEQKAQKPHKMMDVNAGQVTMVHGGPSDNTAAPLLAVTNSTHSDSAAGVKMGNAKAALLKLQEKAPI